MSNNDDLDGWENLMSPAQRAEYELEDRLQAASEAGYKAGYEEGERDGYNRCRAEMEAANAGKVSESKRPTLTIKGSGGSSDSSETD